MQKGFAAIPAIFVLLLTFVLMFVIAYFTGNIKYHKNGELIFGIDENMEAQDSLEALNTEKEAYVPKPYKTALFMLEHSIPTGDDTHPWTRHVEVSFKDKKIEPVIGYHPGIEAYENERELNKKINTFDFETEFSSVFPEGVGYSLQKVWHDADNIAIGKGNNGKFVVAGKNLVSDEAKVLHIVDIEYVPCGSPVLLDWDPTNTTIALGFVQNSRADFSSCEYREIKVIDYVSKNEKVFNVLDFAYEYSGASVYLEEGYVYLSRNDLDGRTQSSAFIDLNKGTEQVHQIVDGRLRPTFGSNKSDRDYYFNQKLVPVIQRVEDKELEVLYIYDLEKSKVMTSSEFPYITDEEGTVKSRLGSVIVNESGPVFVVQDIRLPPERSCWYLLEDEELDMFLCSDTIYEEFGGNRLPTVSDKMNADLIWVSE